VIDRRLSMSARAVSKRCLCPLLAASPMGFHRRANVGIDHRARNEIAQSNLAGVLGRSAPAVFINAEHISYVSVAVVRGLAGGIDRSSVSARRLDVAARRYSAFRRID